MTTTSPNTADNLSYVSLLGNSLTSATDVIVAPAVANMNVTPAATYHLQADDGNTTNPQTLTYDVIFDMSLNRVDSTALLNSFASRYFFLDRNPGDGLQAQMAEFEASAAAVTVLKKVLQEATIVALATNPPTGEQARFDAVGQTSQVYLNKQLNAWVNGQLSQEAIQAKYQPSATAETGLLAGLPTAGLLLLVDQESGSVAVDYDVAAANVASTCFSSGLAEQIPFSSFSDYAGGNNDIITAALPLLTGDKLVFATLTIPAPISFTPTPIDAPTGLPTGSLGSTYTVNEGDLLPAVKLAFRISLCAVAEEGVVPAAGVAFAVGGGVGELRAEAPVAAARAAIANFLSQAYSHYYGLNSFVGTANAAVTADDTGTELASIKSNATGLLAAILTQKTDLEAARSGYETTLTPADKASLAIIVNNLVVIQQLYDEGITTNASIQALVWTGPPAAE